ATNLFMLGYAWQLGLVPVSAAAIERAIELNQVAVASNKAAFAWGRRAAVEPDAVERAAAPAAPVRLVPTARPVARGLDETVAIRRDFLVGYQNRRYAARYVALVDRVRAAERALAGDGPLRLSEAVARSFFKLMAYKDEYEVARLYSDARFRERLESQFEGDYRLTLHLAPPLLARRNAKGELVKREYGPWMLKAFRLLAPLRILRGTALDPFGRTEERRAERRLVTEYEALVERLLDDLDRERLDLAVEIAGVAEQIRGFGHVKERNLKAAEARLASLVARYEAARPVARAS